MLYFCGAFSIFLTSKCVRVQPFTCSDGTNDIWKTKKVFLFLKFASGVGTANSPSLFRYAMEEEHGEGEQDS